MRERKTEQKKRKAKAKKSRECQSKYIIFYKEALERVRARNKEESRSRRKVVLNMDVYNSQIISKTDFVLVPRRRVSNYRSFLTSLYRVVGEG